MPRELCNEQILKEEILALSNAKVWDDACQEWEHDFYDVNESSCICTHRILQEFHIKNRLNGNRAIIGCVCIQKFPCSFDNVHTIPAVMKRIKRDHTASANKALIQYAFKKFILSYRDYNFYMDIGRKRNLTVAQMNYKVGLNKKLIKRIDPRPLPVRPDSDTDSVSDDSD